MGQEYDTVFVGAGLGALAGASLKEVLSAQWSYYGLPAKDLAERRLPSPTRHLRDSP
ncbi:hypothetical protein [Pseudomonas chlororaphis]|uniref:hypothetical protein n=1 Tax=Pseudomonas chlororaphis TaxID=587753 RepID=UPI000A8A67B9|nr:hypothetical protein [Pseudomonas chlororaphis]